ncbi:hypothetical protein BDR07DRAFT_1371620 [Suillus spraguei]|nr:hypothetical protein BDR07DRAFT_1371620 [Suillus spraguei]
MDIISCQACSPNGLGKHVMGRLSPDHVIRSFLAPVRSPMNDRMIGDFNGRLTPVVIYPIRTKVTLGAVSRWHDSRSGTIYACNQALLRESRQKFTGNVVDPLKAVFVKENIRRVYLLLISTIVSGVCLKIVYEGAGLEEPRGQRTFRRHFSSKTGANRSANPVWRGKWALGSDVRENELKRSVRRALLKDKLNGEKRAEAKQLHKANIRSWDPCGFTFM